jgi:cytochrome P450
MLSNIYSKSTILSSAALLAQTSSIIYTRFLPYLSFTFSSSTAGTLNIQAVNSALTMDIVTAYIFGLASSSNLTDNPDQLAWFLDLYNSRRSYNFWPQEFPGLTAWLRRWAGWRLVPQWVDDANGEIEKWTEGMCDSAAGFVAQMKERQVESANEEEKGDEQVGVRAEDTPVVYHQLLSALLKEARKNDSGITSADLKYAVASELLDHLAAGFDTSGITLTYIVHELCKRPDVQAKLRAELLTLAPQLIPSSAPRLPDPKAIDKLPYLHAVVYETLRLRSAIPGPQPRFTPPQGCRLGPDEKSYYVPGGVRVSASAGILHLNEEVYEKAEKWTPERWLEDVPEEKRKDMESRWFWAFGRYVRV